MPRARQSGRRLAESVEEDDMLPEYDFSKGIRGATAKRFANGVSMVVLDPDVAAAFPDPNMVNEALRLLAQLARSATTRRKSSARPRSRKR